MSDKERVYDSLIFPLMAKIIEICKENKIAFLADFSLDDDLKCTSAALGDDCSPTDAQLKAFALLRPQLQSYAFAETTETLEDGTKRITIRQLS